MTQGKAAMDPLGEFFTIDAFESLVAHNPDRSVRDFLLDHDIVTPISPKHADAIIKAAQLEAGRSVGGLAPAEVHRLHREIRDVLGRLVEGHHGYES
jgi:formamidopyrimidine-DNA glycosylase